MLELKGLPQSPEELLGLITKAERSKKYVWTPGRIVIQTAMRTQIESLEWKYRKAIFKQLHDWLEDLTSQGILERRQLRQSIRLGNEIGYNYIPDSPDTQRQLRT
jgi:hypothetical protein